MIGAERTASGYQVALESQRRGSIQVWNTDSNGNYQSLHAVVSGTSAVLKSFETSFRQDLNGDGVIGVARRLSAACADRRMARRYRLNPRPAFAPPVRHRPWRARARGHGAAAAPTAAPLRAALRRSRRQLRRQLRPRRQHQLLHQVLLAETAASSRAVQLLLSARPSTRVLLQSVVAEGIWIPPNGRRRGYLGSSVYQDQVPLILLPLPRSRNVARELRKALSSHPMTL